MRIIARLDVKNEFVIKGIHLEGLRKVGDPNHLAKAYYDAAIDEIIFIDAVASLYNRNNLFSIIREASKEVFVPITIGGGIRTIGDIDEALDSGADKVAINTEAVRNPKFIEEAAKRYGSQCIVASIQAKRIATGWEAYVETGREKTGLSVLDWAVCLQNLGAGEILLTSVDKEGTRSGFDMPLIEAVNDLVKIPVVASGGYGHPKHCNDLLKRTEPSGLCFASVLHYKTTSVGELRKTIDQARSKCEI
ncbi:imidazole glycerol phosphate synthase cyclase subunit [Noviherbaspirillum sp. CPCC 100848]|uniref:imidazole glycerol-phosphate synthase n=1 Tax=Noviherbaspirillum album TaxID=3080276 RepID=A0ABU6JCG4_9BURK|nr:imidazole glycerol phosphate synthase cyclase subunit [Noviherbaspirillum sp. CPCC 100848]MEC4721340.1 imidazole glycerol phosphate synthase cyclase subunit [Noviherbaspirillum sp. CPCC 100848]